MLQGVKKKPAVLVRFSRAPSLLGRIRAKAKAQGKSVNQFILDILAKACDDESKPGVRNSREG